MTLNKINKKMINGLEEDLSNITTQLAQIKYFGEYLNNRIKNNETIKVKLVGDSITAGDGAKGFYIPTDNPVIFVDGATTYREASYDSNSWANLFRRYILSLKPGNTFYNWGIGGMYASWWNARKNNFTNEDIVFVMLGTNDRVNSLSLEHFRTQLTELLLHLRSVSNYVVVMSANPLSSNAESSSYKFTQEAGNRAIKEICLEHDFPFISHYESFMEFSKSNAGFEKLLADGIHPNDDGYQLYWEKLQEELNIYDLTYQQNKPMNQSKIIPENFDLFNKKFGLGSYVIGSNFQKNSLIESWTTGVPTGLTLSNASAEQVPALYKGNSAVKLTPTISNGYVTFPASLSTKREKMKLIFAYESVGVTRLQIIQNGNLNHRVNVKLPSGKNVIEFPFDFEAGYQDTFSVRIYPNLSQITGGYTIVDFIVAVKEDQSKWGYFTDENRVNVKWFGLKGDGSNENAVTTAMLQQLGIGATSDARTIFFPKGTYNIGSVANVNKKIIIEGEGKETVITGTIPNALFRNVAIGEAVRNDVLLRSPNGSQYLISVDDAGVLSSTPWTY